MNRFMFLHLNIMLACLLLIICGYNEVIAAEIGQQVDYTGHVVLRLHPRSPSHYRLIWNLSERDYLDLEIWGEPLRNHTLDIRVAPHSFNYITKCFTYYNIKWNVEISDVQRNCLFKIQSVIKIKCCTYTNSLIDAQTQPHTNTMKRIKRSIQRSPVKPKKRRRYRGKKYRHMRKMRRRKNARRRHRREFTGGTIVGQYARYRQIRLWMKYLENTFSDLVQVIEIGRTYENRAFELIKIGSNSNSRNKSAIWIDGGIHGREWIAPATVIYIIEKLLTDYGKDEVTRELVDKFDWYILPVANPDGYEYSHTVDRLWRKTRSRSQMREYSRCLGVDLNRNFGFQWKGHCDKNWLFLCGSSNPCQSTYAGEVPFSEPEARAIAEKLYVHKDRIKLYLSLHSYSQLWLTPWGYTDNPPKDKLDLMNIARKGMDALRKTHGTRYTAGSPANILYAAGGGSYDWAKAVAGIKYSYTLELRDKGRYGFLLPQQYILPVGEETWNAVKVVASELHSVL